jgi:single-strand DNA-binding protein
MNKVILIGNLTRDPELRQTANGVAVCSFSIAVNRRFKGTDGNAVTDYFNIVTWRTTAENCGKFLTKGKKVAVSGELQNRQYESDGAKRTVTEIVADEVQFLSTSDSGSKSEPKLKEVDEDLPF